MRASEERTSLRPFFRLLLPCPPPTRPVPRRPPARAAHALHTTMSALVTVRVPGGRTFAVEAGPPAALRARVEAAQGKRWEL